MTHTTSEAIKTAHKRYTKSDLYTLRDCYGRFSGAKMDALKRCYHLMSEYNGRQSRIISYNQFQFTFGFIGVINGRNAFFYITRNHDRYIYIEELEV